MSLVTQPNGATLIANAWQPPHLAARRFVQAFASNSKPLLFECSDGQLWAVKSPRVGFPERPRSLFLEQVVGRLGASLGAAVPQVQVVDVPAALVGPRSETLGVIPGPASGTQFIPGLLFPDLFPGPNDQHLRPLTHSDFAAAPVRRLGLLMTWVGAACQVHVVPSAGRPLVYGLDYETLPASEGAQVGPVIVRLPGSRHQPPQPTAEDFGGLRAFTPEAIATALACPDEWGISVEERAAFLDHLVRRRDALLRQADCEHRWSWHGVAGYCVRCMRPGDKPSS
jgi:hypothetical protein